MSECIFGYLVGLAIGGFVGWQFSWVFSRRKLHREKMKFMEDFANEIEALLEPKKESENDK